MTDTNQTEAPCRKLIEVALPLEAINREAAREKSIRHGHPFTLHLWWARRPLAACRAVLFAQLVDDPSAHPDRFPTEKEQDQERQRLFRLIERLVRWEAAQDEAVLKEAREEIRRSCGDALPEVLDPFCGGGSIPLEAQRLGLVAHGSDLNPVAVLITKALIELPARFANRPPIHPRGGDGRLAVETWRGAQGLAEDVRYYGAWMREEAERRIGHLYPKAILPDGRQATVIAWIWARTVTCPNPACRATMPLVRSFWLGKKKGKEAWVRPVVEGGFIRFEIGHGKSGPPIEGTVSRTGATCLVCNTPVPLAHVRAEGKAGRMGEQLVAIAAEGDRQRIYLPPNPEHEKAADVTRPDDAPDTDLPEHALGFRVQGYGMSHHADLFTNRQLTALCVLSDLVIEAHQLLIDNGAESEYADAVVTYLAFVVDRQADLGNALCRWEPVAECPRQLFARQAIPMVWDHAEGNPLGDSSGGWSVLMEGTQRAFSSPAFTAADAQIGRVVQRDVLQPIRDQRPAVLSTDPPYYDNVGYSDLSDFFYVWSRRSLLHAYPELCATMLTPKKAELVAEPSRSNGDTEEAERRFEEGFEHAFANLRTVANPAYPLTVFYAFKQAERDEGGVASTGWETMLAGLLHSGLAVTATWPIRTEASNRMRNQASNALASSIVLACRPRSETAGITDRRGYLAALHAELPQALRELQQGNIAPVDLAQAAIGPGMAVFSRYAKVVEPTGEPMSVRSALALINQVLDEVLAEQEGEFDADTRFAIKWFEQFGFDEAGYDPAEGLARATNVSVKGLEDAGILLARAGRVRLLRRGELAADWDPATDTRMPVWEVTQQLVRALWDEGSESKAGDLVRRLGGVGEVARDLAYRLYAVCERRGWAEDALGFNALVTSWPEIARRASSPAPVQQELVQ
jgi:putative DNA methylase